MATIEDGTGNGYKAKVDDNKRLYVDSKSSFAEEVAAQQGNAFVFSGQCHLKAGASGGFLAITNDDGDKLIAVSRIYIDAHSLSDDLIVYQVKNPVPAGGTDISSTGITNKNFASARVLTATLVISDGSADMTYTGGTIYHAFPVKSLTSYQRDMKGTNILDRDDVLVFGWATVDGGPAVDGEIVSFSVNCYTLPVTES